MQGRVMPSFPHTLISLGPFTDLGCTITFIKTDVTIVDPDGRCILKGWRKRVGPWLWHFPLKATKPSLPALHKIHEKPVPRVSSANFSQLLPATTINAAMPTPSVPPPCISRGPPLAPLAHSLHPSQGIQAIGPQGKACSVLYLYGAAKAMAMAASTSSTPFDPRSMDLPRISALVGFYHACLGFPVKQTWLDAIRAGNCDSFDGLTYSNVAHYCPDANKIILGHLAQQCQNVKSTKPKSSAPPALTPTSKPPTPLDLPSHQVFIKVQPLSRLYTDSRGCFLVKARSGNQYVMIAFQTNGNLILQQAFKTRNDPHQIVAYNAIMTQLAVDGLAIDLQILDNEARTAYTEAITIKWKVKFQLVPPDVHRRNQAKCAICTFKSHFLSILAGVDSTFSPYLWDLLFPHTEQTLNFLRQSTLNPRISAWEYFQGPFDFNKMSLGLVGCWVLIHAKPVTRQS